MANRDWHIGDEHGWAPGDRDAAPGNDVRSQDPYEVLGVSPSAPTEVVRAAYRALVAKHHPDRNAGDRQAELELRRLNAAFQLLADPAERRRHDARTAPATPPSFASALPRAERPTPRATWPGRLVGWLAGLAVLSAAIAVVGPEACETRARGAGSAFARTCAAAAINHPRTMRALAATAGADPSDCQLSAGACVCTWQFYEAQGTRKIVGTARHDDGAEDPELPGPERVKSCLGSPGAMLKVQLGDGQPISLRSE